MADITALLERLEGATEGSRELDARLQANEYGEEFEWLADREYNRHDPLSVCWHAKSGRRYTCWRSKAYTRSLDAAMSLVPEGHAFILKVGSIDDGNAEKQPMAHVWKHGDETGVCIYAPTPALALCIAALKARKVTA